MEKLKCTRFDLSDPNIEYTLFKKTQERKGSLGFFSKQVHVIPLYKKIKTFKSKSELDLWCALSDVEYEFTNKINIEK